MSCQYSEIFAALFPALADNKGNEHFAAPDFVGDVADNIHAKGIEFYFAKTCIEGSEEKFANRGSASHGGMIGTKDDCVGSVGANEVVQLAAIAGKSPIKGDFADGSLDAAHRSAAARSAKLRGCGIVRDRPRNGTCTRILAGCEIVMVKVVMIVMLAGRQSFGFGKVGSARWSRVTDLSAGRNRHSAHFAELAAGTIGMTAGFAGDLTH